MSSRKHQELLQSERHRQQVLAMKVQQSVLRLAKITEDRQRNEAERRHRQQLRDQQARDKILAMRKARHQSAAPPWRLGAYSKPGSATIRPLITTGQQRDGRQRGAGGRDDEAIRHLLFQDSLASNSLQHSLTTQTTHGGLGNGRRMGAQSAPPTRSGGGAGTRQEEVLRILDGPRPPSSGRSHLSYIAKHNGRDVRVVKGYAVEIRDMTNDGVVKTTLSTPQVSQTATLPTLPSNTSPSPANPYLDKRGSLSSGPLPAAEAVGPKRAIILDLTPCPDGAPDEGAKDGDDPIMHGTYAREPWVQSSRTQSTGVMRIRPASACVSSSDSSGASGSRPSSSSRLGRTATTPASEDTEEKPIFVRKEPEENVGGSGQQVAPPPTQPAMRGGRRVSILSSRPNSGRPSSGRNITFAKDTQVIWDCDHRAQISDDESGPAKVEASDKDAVADADAAAELAARTTSNTNSHSALNVAAVPASPKAPLPLTNATANPTKPNRSPLSAPPRRLNLSALPTNFLTALAHNPRTAIPPSIRELLRKDALASQSLTLNDKTRTRSAPPVRREMSASNVGTDAGATPEDGNANRLQSSHPSRLPRWKSSSDTRRAAIKARAHIPHDNIVKAWKSKDCKATTEICVYAQAPPSKLPTPPESRPSTQQYSRWSYEGAGIYPGDEADDGSDSPPNEGVKKASENEIIASIQQLDRILEPKLKRLSLPDVTRH
ncbi:hypothetical protein HDU86_005746 [Geranomyces michiganensis]|nr:hypothetical protein HDU86_005746 [Geranomyces michiganensis]